MSPSFLFDCLLLRSAGTHSYSYISILCLAIHTSYLFSLIFPSILLSCPDLPCSLSYFASPRYTITCSTLHITFNAQIIAGASHAVQHNLGIFTFEGDGVSLTKAMIDDYDRMGYSCFSTSRAGLFKVSVGKDETGKRWRMIRNRI